MRKQLTSYGSRFSLTVPSQSDPSWETCVIRSRRSRKGRVEISRLSIRILPLVNSVKREKDAPRVDLPDLGAKKEAGQMGQVVRKREGRVRTLCARRCQSEADERQHIWQRQVESSESD